jgi:hypothetical protein
MWKDDDQVDARLPQGLRRLPQAYAFSKYSAGLAEHEVHDSVVHGMRQWQRHAASALSPGALEHRWMKSMTKPARPCMKYVSRKMLAWYTKYPPTNDGAAAAVEASAPPPRTRDRPAAAADEPRPKCGMTFSDDEGQADKYLLNNRALQAGRSGSGKGKMGGGVLGT